MEMRLAVAVLTCLCVQLSCAEDYHPERTLLVDVYPQTNPINFLFRGNMPVVNGKFAYNDIVATMRTVAAKSNFTLPTNFTLMDVSYLNIFEEEDLKIERDFFADHPELGKFDNTVIIGTVIPPPQDDINLIKDVVKEYVELSMDKLPDVLEYLHNLLLQPSPTVIFSHCEAGTDRTGEVSGAYYMRYRNMSFTTALYIDNHVQNRDMYTMSRNAMQWYCFYLRFIKNYSQLECMV